MALGGKVNHIVNIVFGKQLVGQCSVADVTFYEKAPFPVDIIFDGTQVAGVGKGIEDDDADVFVGVLLVQ